MGKAEEALPPVYEVWDAAKQLNMSFVELAEHPERASLIKIAQICTAGYNEGQFALQVNPEFKRLVKQRSKQIEVK